MTLTERLTQATAEEQGEVLRELCSLLNPKLKASNPAYEQWNYARVRFNQLVMAGAYIDAALLLVPVAMHVTLSIAKQHMAVLTLCHDDPMRAPDDWVGVADTPALALAAAILKTKEMSDVKG